MFQTLQGDSDLQSKPASKGSREKSLQDSYLDHVDPKLDCTLVILPSSHSPTGLVTQRKDSILTNKVKIKDIKKGFLT